jgi:septal ring factor EnvC (AmiA/AmiB activator)
MGEPARSLEARVAVLEQIARSTAAAIDRIERQLEAMGGRIDRLERRIDAIETAHRADFRWLMGTLLGLTGMTLAGWASLLGVMAHGFHWL